MQELQKRFEVVVFGSRGSTPTPYPDRMKFGGNTSCIRVLLGGRMLIFDAGTGVIGLGEEMMCGKYRSADLFISHAHLDHLQGIPFFQPFFSPEFSIRVRGEKRSGLSIREQISASMNAPLWPVNIETFRADISYIDIQEGEQLDLGDGILLYTTRSNHPNLCTAFKLLFGGRSMVYALDFEHSPESSARLEAFATGVDLLIYDGQYTNVEYRFKHGWGHSTWQEGIQLAECCGAKQLLLSHHSPDRTDAQLLKMEKEAQALYRACSFAREGDAIYL